MISNYHNLKRIFLNVRSFSYRGAMVWNQLSNQTRDIGDLTTMRDKSVDTLP